MKSAANPATCVNNHSIQQPVTNRQPQLQFISVSHLWHSSCGMWEKCKIEGI